MQALIQPCSLSDRKEKREPSFPRTFYMSSPGRNRTLKTCEREPSGCHTNIPDVMTFDVSFRSVPRIAFSGEIPRAALSPEHSDTKALWLLVHVRPFTREPNHKGLGQPIPGLQGLGRNRTLETDCCPPCFQMSKVTYGGGRFIQRKFPNELLHCLSLSDSFLLFLPSSACGNNTFFVYKILICNKIC